MNTQNKRTKFFVFITFILVAGFIVAVTQNVNAKNDKSNNGNGNSNKEVVIEKLKGYEKPEKGNNKPNTDDYEEEDVDYDKKNKPEKEEKDYKNPNKPTTNAFLYEENMEEVVEEIDEVATDEDLFGNDEVGEELQEIADDEEDEVEDVIEIIEDVEGQNKFKVLLFGTDYKNLGKLRSNLVHNRNQIRKITKSTEKVQSEESTLALQEQLVVLTQERERIKDVIEENESQFSVLGWVGRFLSGYTEEPLDTEEEEEIFEEVADVLDEEIVDDILLEEEEEPLELE